MKNHYFCTACYRDSNEISLKIAVLGKSNEKSLSLSLSLACSCSDIDCSCETVLESCLFHFILQRIEIKAELQNRNVVTLI